jgi:hypothetical protein
MTMGERLLSNLSPYTPFPYKGRGYVSKRGAKPLSKISPSSMRAYPIKSVLRGALAPLSSPPSPFQGEGDKGGEVDKQPHQKQLA